MTALQSLTVILLLVGISFWLQKMLFTLENIFGKIKKIEKDLKGGEHD